MVMVHTSKDQAGGSGAGVGGRERGEANFIKKQLIWNAISYLSPIRLISLQVPQEQREYVNHLPTPTDEHSVRLRKRCTIKILFLVWDFIEHGCTMSDLVF